MSEDSADSVGRGARLAAGAVVLLLLAVGGAYALGVGPLPLAGDAADGPDGGTSDTDGGSGSTGDAGGSGGGGGADDASGAAETERFDFAIQRIEKCGDTCRDVTASLTNTGNATAEDVTVAVTMYVKNDQIWEGSSDLGTLETGESKSETDRVKIGYFDGAKIKNNDGYVTIETTVTWDGGSTTFSERRKVA